MNFSIFTVEKKSLYIAWACFRNGHPYTETETMQKTAARWVCWRWHNTSSFDDLLDELEWSSLEDRRLKCSLTFFYKIHSSTVPLDKDRYLTPAPRLRYTRASHESQYTRYMSYSDALKNSFFPRTIPVWNSLPSSVVASKTTEESLKGSYLNQGPRGIRFSMPLSSFL